jgi:gamma-glutamylcyclotransferase (GGCT)/AIG2-like uncharacterized protein YtfP
VANFSLNSYTISVSANPSEGGTVSGGGTFNYGESCTVTATANSGYTFDNWTKNGSVVSTNANYSFTVTGGGTYVANFSLNTYTISASANPTEGGTISGGGTYNHGETCTLTASANSGYTFINWTENGSVVSNSANYSFIVNDDHTLVANFTVNQPQQYIVTVTADPSEGGTVSGGGTFNQGESCTVTATANSGFTFDNWTENGSVVSYSADYTFIVNDDHTLVANFTVNQPQQYIVTVTANPSDGGIVSGGGTFNQGESCTVTATANSGFTFDSWTENGSVVSNSANYSFIVNDDHTLVANFTTNQPQQYTITASADPIEGGTVYGSGNYDQGAVCTLTALPNTGFQFVNWTKDGNVIASSNTFSFNVTESTTYVAHFSIIKFTITVSANPVEGGVVTGGSVYDYGSLATVTVTPNVNYFFVNWTENGQDVSNEMTYSFTVTEDRALVAQLSFWDEIDEQHSGLLVYPNPSHDKLFVECDQLLVRCELYSIVGTCVGIIETESMTVEVPLEHLPAGMYLVKAITENRVLTCRFVKR